jgi:hypothetical protein
MSDEMVTLTTFGDPIEAQLVKSRLEEEGISAFITGGEAGGLFAGMGGAFGLVRLLVAERDQERAIAILEDAEEEADEQQPEGQETAIRAPEWRRQTAAGRTDSSISDIKGDIVPGEPSASGPTEAIELQGDEEDEEDHHIAWRPDEVAWRALKAAVVGLMFVPFFFCLFTPAPIVFVLPFAILPIALEVYSLSLLVRLIAGENLSYAGKWKVAAALVIALAVLAPLALFLSGILAAILANFIR